MRIVRFALREGSDRDPQYGMIEDDGRVRAIASDPIYAGIHPLNERFDLDDLRLLAPVIPRSKVVCVGKNYADHAAEMGGEVPKVPVIFIKPNTSVIGPEDQIVWPEVSKRVDHEGELAIVINRICRQVPREKFRDVIFGYTMANDVTCREIQKKDGQWMRAKSFDIFCPIGPWIETEFVPGNQRITTTLNGEIKQDAKLSDMIFKVADIVHFVTQVMTLLPGDVIITGTPAGIGPMPEKSTVAISIEGLGQLTNKVSARA